MSETLEAIVIEQLGPLGLELFQLRSGGTKSRPVLDVRIERRDGEKITVDDCAKASRAIEACLDAGNSVSERYTLEVSSPGVERPLRNVADWRRFVGRDAVITTDSGLPGGALDSRDVRIAGVEGEAGDEIVVVEDAAGQAHRVPLVAIKKGRLAFNWKR